MFNLKISKFFDFDLQMVYETAVYILSDYSREQRANCKEKYNNNNNNNIITREGCDL